MAISALLMAAAMRVTTTASRCSLHDRDEQKNLTYSAQFERLLMMDIHDAEGYRVTEENTLEFKLRSRLDEKTFAIKHSQSTVVYRVIQADGKSWLAREQNSGTSVLREFAAVDVEKITPEVESSPKEAESETPTTNPSGLTTVPATTSAPAEDGWQRMPDKFSVIIEFTEGTEPSRTVSCLLN